MSLDALQAKISDLEIERITDANDPDEDFLDIIAGYHEAISVRHFSDGFEIVFLSWDRTGGIDRDDVLGTPADVDEAEKIIRGTLAEHRRYLDEIDAAFPLTDKD